MEYSSPIETTQHRKDSMQSMVSNINETQTLTSSSDSNQSDDSRSNLDVMQPVIKEDEALEDPQRVKEEEKENKSVVTFDIQRSQGVLLKPNKATKSLSKRMPC